MMLKSYGSVFGDRYGVGPPEILALHGWSRDRHDFRALLQPFSAIAADLPGFGASPPPPTATGSVGYAASLLPLLEEFRSPPIVIGHSFGGRVALQLAHQTSVRGLVLTGVPLLRTEGQRPRPDIRYRILRSLHRLGLVGDTRLEAARRTYGSDDYRAARGVMRDVLVTVLAESYEDVLRPLSCRVELVWGSEDREVPVEVAERALALLSHGSLNVVEGGGHLLPVEAPAALREALERLR